MNILNYLANEFLPRKFNTFISPRLWDKAVWYLENVCKQEMWARYIAISLLYGIIGFPFWITIIISSAIFGLGHKKQFSWWVVLLTFVFGLALGSAYLHFTALWGHPFGYLICVGLHWIGGMLAYWAGLMK